MVQRGLLAIVLVLVVTVGVPAGSVMERTPAGGQTTGGSRLFLLTPGVVYAARSTDRRAGDRTHAMPVGRFMARGHAPWNGVSRYRIKTGPQKERLLSAIRGRSRPASLRRGDTPCRPRRSHGMLPDAIAQHPPRRAPAVEDLSIIAGAGEFHALPGANGAGKSTTIKMLLGFAEPTSGWRALSTTSTSRSTRLPPGAGGLHPGDRQPARKSDTPTRTWRTSPPRRTGDPVPRQRRRRLRVRRAFELGTPAAGLVAIRRGMRQAVGVATRSRVGVGNSVLDEPTSGPDQREQ